MFYSNSYEVVELILDNCRCPKGKIVGLTDEFLNLELLSMADVGLASLDGLPKLPKLRKLELPSNCISRLDALAEKTPALVQLNLRDNKIKDVSTLKPLKKLTMLRSVELLDCEVSALLEYRELVLAFLSQVTYLDGYDTNDKAALSSGSELSADEDGSSDQPENEEDGTEEDDDVESEDGNTEEEGDALDDESDALDDDDIDDDIDDGDDVGDDGDDVGDDDDDVGDDFDAGDDVDDADDLDDDYDDVKEMSPAKKRRKCHDDDSDDSDDSDGDDD
ncbi:acidic leucine-rich nuclear phosphoprotein 32 family member B-like isoform X2 [Paramormyrops kingsleyae]|uniref:Acidic leucine-rich nuclear phosphoprotein 32 family member n=1 Tax=Paramormyrops kingsleyae TaxID=1676925 RepID=A0A3B3T9K3_9TELE